MSSSLNRHGLRVGYPYDRFGVVRVPSSSRSLVERTEMTLNLDYPDLLDLFREHLAPGRTESAAFLIWYLENYYPLDRLEAQDAVCDSKGDKGVDGIFVNDDDQTITIFQSYISKNSLLKRPGEAAP